MDKISLKICTDYNEQRVSDALDEAMNVIGGLGSIIKPGDTVLIKPNLTGPFAPEQAATTHPALVKAVVRLVKACGGIPMIGEGPATVVSPLEITGMLELAKQEEIPISLFSEFQSVCCENSYTSQLIRYSKDVLQADKVISIPKLKTHALTLFTGAIKNMFGAVEFEQRKVLHKYQSIEDFSKVLVDVFGCRIPDLTIMDGIWGMEGIGPVHGKPVNFGFLVCSKDAVAVDALSATILGYSLSDILMIQYAAEKKIGICDLSLMDIDMPDYDQKAFKYQLIPFLKGNVRNRFLKKVLGSLACDHQKCVLCEMCKMGCPADAIAMVPYPKVDEDSCLHCYRCYEVCFHGALMINYSKYRV